MKPEPFKRTPVLIAAGVIVAICMVRWMHFDELEQIEAQTFDWRARFATNFTTTTATNLGFVYISDDSIARLNDGSLGYRYGLYWPRHIYGRLVRELSAQGAKAVGFDVLFSELRPDHSPVLVNTNTDPGLVEFLVRLHPHEPPFMVGNQVNVESDDFLAWELERAGNVIIAAEKKLSPHEMFREHAAAMGDISAEKDSDGVLRRARAFTFYPSGRSRASGGERVWHMGIVLAARELGLDLDHAEIDLPNGRIVLRGAGGMERVIPVDRDGFFYVDWQLTPHDPRLACEPIEKLLALDYLRGIGETNELENSWRGKLVVVGSVATGNDLTDLGATPLERETLLISKHWNVANSIITGRFIRRTVIAEDLLAIVFLGMLAALFTLQLRALPALFSVLALALAYLGLTLLLYVQHRLWLPVILPVAGALFVQYSLLVTWRVVFEQAEKRRVRSVFAKIVSPDVVRELLEARSISLGGARREITVLFADVRGFTSFTDASHENAVAIAREKNLSTAAAKEHFDLEARETLNTVNAYLALVADKVKQHRGTLDKYIGDCVMAFWNAPTLMPQHALACVRAAIETQRAIDELNRQRAVENNRRELENNVRTTAGQAPLPLLPILSLGMGINTGQAVVGLMGSEAHILNYTVFGREVNLASRLEALSGRGHILIGETTFAAIQRDDTALAATCTALPPVNVKGIREAVKVYDVPWRLPVTISPIGDDYGSAAASVTTFISKPL